MDNEMNGEGYRRLTELQLKDAQRFYKKVHGREWDSTPLEAVAIDHAIHSHQGLQDDDEQQDDSSLVNIFANIFVQLLGETEEGEEEDDTP